jgi:predicted RNA-binding Zn-ribbon protein involved in translation (DUF1610 family)
VSRKTKSAAEVFCRSCGEPIKREAELCPNCGVRNREKGSRKRKLNSRNKTQNRSIPAIEGLLSYISDARQVPHDPSEYETTIGENWHYVIIIPSIFTIPTFSLLLVVPSDRPLLFVPVIFSFIGAALLPIIGVYFDRKYVQANSKWNPSIFWMVGFLIFYLFNIFLAVLYIKRRRSVID